MIADVSAVVWKELRELRSELFFGRGKMQLAGLIFVGVMIALMARHGPPSPWMVSFDVIFFCAISTIMAVAETVAGERERHTLETLLASRLGEGGILIGKFCASVIYGLVFGAVSMLALYAAASGRSGGLYHLPLAAWALMTGGSVVACGFVAAIGVLISMDATAVRQTQQMVSLGVMIPCFLFFLVADKLPKSWIEAAQAVHRALGGLGVGALVGLVIVAITAVLLAIARARFRRERLVLG